MNASTRADAVPVKHSRLRRFLSAYIQPLIFVIGFPLAFGSALHAPAPHELDLLVVGPSAVVAEAASALDETDQFAVRHTDDVEDARGAVERREVAGSIEVTVVPAADDGGAPSFTVTTYIASGGGLAVAGVVQQAGAQLAKGFEAKPVVKDVAPLADGDGLGTGLFFLLTYISLGGYLVVISLMQFRPKARLRIRYLAVAINAVAAPLLVFGISSIFVGGYGASGAAILGLLGVASLYVFTIGALAILLNQFLGNQATVGIMAVIVFLGFPASGGAISGSLMPAFWRMMHEIYFTSGAMESFRSIIYFQGNGLGRWLVQLVLWALVALLLTGIVHLGRALRASRLAATGEQPAPAPSAVMSAGKLNPKVMAVVGTAIMPLYFMTLLTTSFMSAQHNPQPYNFALTVAGPDSATSQLSDALNDTAAGAFDISTTTDLEHARQQVMDRDASGAILIGDDGVTAVEASAGGTLAAGVMRSVGQAAADELGVTLTVDDVAPLGKGDTSGTGLFFLFVACTVGAFLCVVGPAQVMPTLRTRRMLISNAVGAIAIPLVAFAMLFPFVGDFDAGFGSLAGALGVAMLYTFTVGLLATFFQKAVGIGGVFLVILCAVALNFPSAGGSVPATMLPPFWQGIHGVWFGAGGFEAMRSIVYFGGAGATRYLVQLLIWTVLLAILVLLPTIRQRHRVARSERSQLERDLDAAAGLAPLTGPVAVPTQRSVYEPTERSSPPLG